MLTLSATILAIIQDSSTRPYVIKNARTNSKDVELVSSLPLETCRSRLISEIDAPWTVLGNRPVIGQIAGTKLRARKRIWYRNSFQISMSAEMVERDGYTHILCRFSMHPFVRIFITVWFTGVLLVGGLVFLASLASLSLADQSVPAGTWPGLILPIGMFLLGLGAVRVGRTLAGDERLFLLDFLCKTLTAKLLAQPR